MQILLEGLGLRALGVRLRVWGSGVQGSLAAKILLNYDLEGPPPAWGGDSKESLPTETDAWMARPHKLALVEPKRPQ